MKYEIRVIFYDKLLLCDDGMYHSSCRITRALEIQIAYNVASSLIVVTYHGQSFDLWRMQYEPLVLVFRLIGMHYRHEVIVNRCMGWHSSISTQANCC